MACSARSRSMRAAWRPRLEPALRSRRPLQQQPIERRGLALDQIDQLRRRWRRKPYRRPQAVRRSNRRPPMHFASPLPCRRTTRVRRSSPLVPARALPASASERRFRTARANDGRPRCDMFTPIDQLARQRAQLIAGERDAARAEIVVHDHAHAIGDLGRRATAVEHVAHLRAHLGSEGEPGLLHLGKTRILILERQNPGKRARFGKTTVLGGPRSVEHGTQAGPLDL